MGDGADLAINAMLDYMEEDECPVCQNKISECECGISR